MLSILGDKKSQRLLTAIDICKIDLILADPGADSGDEQKSKRAEKYMARRKGKNGEKSPCFLAPIRSQNGGDQSPKMSVPLLFFVESVIGNSN